MRSYSVMTLNEHSCTAIGHYDVSDIFGATELAARRAALW